MAGGTHIHPWGAPKVMEGHLYEETKPNHWEISPYAVSYTHLTLPTICSV